jgi:hypothetical protein
VNNELMKRIADDSLRFSGDAVIRWKTDDDREHEAVAGRNLLGRHLYLAEPFRKPRSYPRQRNYYGLYYFAQTRSHVWHESLNEANMMAYLDHTESIAAITSQPLKMTFPDGSFHVPDLLALHSNHRQVLYDIKPESKIDSKALIQFAKTMAVCKTIGWGYQVLPTPSEQFQANLTHLSYFKHPRFHPGVDRAARLHHALTVPMKFDAAATLLCPDSLPAGRSSIFHLLWMREVRVDLAMRIGSESVVERNPDA